MSLSTITAKYIGKSFKDYGCIELVVSVMRDMGNELPAEVDGINIDNYKSLVDRDIKHAQVEMLRIFRKIGRPSNCKYPAIGDLLVIIQPHRMAMFPAVSVGFGSAIASFIRRGVMVFPLDKYNIAVMSRHICQ